MAARKRYASARGMSSGAGVVKNSEADTAAKA